MTFHSLRRSDITVHWIEDRFDFDPRWNRHLIPLDGIAAMHPGPPLANAAPTPEGHGEPTVSAPLDADSAIATPPTDDAAGPTVSAPEPAAPATETAPAAMPDAFWHPPYFAPEPQTESSPDPATIPADTAPPGGFIPKSEALIWSGPAVMVFPPDSHDATGDAAAPDSGSTTNSAGTPDLTASPDQGGAPDTAGTPDAVTRADLDPVLAAMGSEPDHPNLFDDDGGNLGAAFLPPDHVDLSHGLDLGMSFTPPPLPPPPDLI
jgi:hypothetical protein